MSLAAERMARIEERLRAALSPSRLAVIDESHKHIGHAGARDGRGHFRAEIVSERFIGLAPLARHRLVYAALGEMMETDIHALALQTHTPEENP